MTSFSIKIISDNVCPFCYLGAKRLDRAIAAQKLLSPSDTFTTTWSAFHLDPHAPSTSEPIQDYINRRFGAARAAAMHERLKATGKAEGIDYTFESKTGNTRTSHRLAQLAKAKGVQDAVVREVMSMYFEHGGDITSEDDLVKAAAKAGLDEGEARAYLRDGRGGDEVDREVAEAGRMGVRGVPHFVINDKWEVHGAEQVETFLEQFAAAKRAGELGA